MMIALRSRFAVSLDRFQSNRCANQKVPAKTTQNAAAASTRSFDRVPPIEQHECRRDREDNAGLAEFDPHIEENSDQPRAARGSAISRRTFANPSPKQKARSELLPAPTGYVDGGGAAVGPDGSSVPKFDKYPPFGDAKA